MKPAAPYYLAGEAGKSLTEVQISLADLCCYNATLSLRSLDVDTLTFQILGSRSKVIPDDGQWISLYDGTGTRLFTGIAKRTYTHPQGIYSYEVSNVYLGLMETNLLSNGRPFITYFADDATNILTDILERAGDAGLAVQPGAMPELFTVPKMSFRASSYASAVEGALKWLPDVTSRMDYSTTPPTLRFSTRTAAAVTTIDLDSGAQKATAVELTPRLEMRALAVNFQYAKRQGDRTIEVLSQSAGNSEAASMLKISVFISGAERMDAFIAEALVTAMDAKAMALELGALDPSTSKTLVLGWDWVKVKEPNIAAAIALQSNFVMYLGTPNFEMPNGNLADFGSGTYSSYGNRNSQTGIAVAKVSLTNGGPAAGGEWRPISDDTAAGWSDSDLARVGLQKIRGYYTNDLFWDSRYLGNMVSAGVNYLFRFWGNKRDVYWNANTVRSFWWRTTPIRVWLVNAVPDDVDSLLAANNISYSLGFISRAEYVDVPPDLAANYFARQDWTPYKGQLSLSPSAADFPAPGDFVSVRGKGTPAEWATMKVPVSELSIDLSTGAAQVKIGPSPRMDFQSLIDRLRIPAEDNYQAG